jgi:hypothetical protein
LSRRRARLCDLASGLEARGQRLEVRTAGDNPTLADWPADRELPSRPLPTPRFGQRDLLGFLRRPFVLAARRLRERPRFVHANSITSAG